MPRHPDREIRLLRQRAHSSFDRIWRLGIMSRAEAYRWLAEKLGVPEPEAHMGVMEDVEMLERVAQVSAELAGPVDARSDFEGEEL